MDEDRVPPIPPHLRSAQQQRVARAIVDGPRGALVAPFVPMLRSPELTDDAQRMGEYLRYRSVLGLRLSELAILVTAQHWSQSVEWAIHAPIALCAGLSNATVESLSRGARPDDLRDDEAVVHDFCVELHRNRTVGETLWRAAVAHFGERGAVDLAGICGYYAMLAMLMNAAHTPAPDAAGVPPLRA